MKTSTAKVTAVLVTLFAALLLYAQRSVQYDPATYVLNLPTNILGFWFGNQYLTNLVGTGLTNDNGNLEATGSGAGTVTSVAASTTISGLGWTGSPITSAGTLGLTGVVGEASIDVALARLASPALTGDPTGPTPAANDNDTSLATTAYVQGEETALKASQLWQATNSVLTAYTTAKRRIGFWDATQFKPITNATAAAIPAVRGNGFHNYTFSATVDQSIVVHGIVPATGVVDLTGGVKVNMILTSSGTSTTNVYSFELMRWTSDLDTDGYDTAVNITNIVSATSGIPTTVTATITTIDSITNGDPFSLRATRLSASNVSDTAPETTQAYSLELTED